MTFTTRALSVTANEARAVKAAVESQFANYLDEKTEKPTLRTVDGVVQLEWFDGPIDWAMTCTGGGIDEEMYETLTEEFEMTPAGARKLATIRPVEAVPGVFLEPISGCVLGLYPE